MIALFIRFSGFRGENLFDASQSISFGIVGNCLFCFEFAFASLFTAVPRHLVCGKEYSILVRRKEKANAEFKKSAFFALLILFYFF